jgi:hypothetical protein
MDSINWLSRELKRPSDQARHQADGERPVSACFAILGDLRALAVNPFFDAERTVAGVERTRAKTPEMPPAWSTPDTSSKRKPWQSVPVVRAARAYQHSGDTRLTAKHAKDAKARAKLANQSHGNMKRFCGLRPRAG